MLGTIVLNGARMSKKLFGTDGVRGEANREPMTAETALKLGRAIARSAPVRTASSRKIVVGVDTRLSCDMLEMALSSGICSMGVDVLAAGIMPTPGIAYLTTSLGCDSGAVISASHNPFQDNGIKFFARDGFKLSDDQEEEIERFLFSEQSPVELPVGDRLGRVTQLRDGLDGYVAFLKNGFPSFLDLKGVKVVLDCANGAAYRVGPRVFAELGADVHALGIQPDGCNINRNCGSLHPEIICKEVFERGADIGVALDGDADRAIFADEHGNEVDGDRIMGLIAWDMIGRGELNRNTLVATVMSNVGLEMAMNEMGGSLVRTPVGDRYVVERMRRDGYNFGGEQSGHLVFLDRNTAGDGIQSALQVMRVMKETGKPLSELAARVKKYPQALKNVEVRSRRDFNEVPLVSKVIADWQARLGRSGRLLVRYSGTQLLCRVMAEGEDESEVNLAVETVADAISRNL